jgi:hypothetical protein
LIKLFFHNLVIFMTEDWFMLVGFLICELNETTLQLLHSDTLSWFQANLSMYKKNQRLWHDSIAQLGIYIDQYFYFNKYIECVRSGVRATVRSNHSIQIRFYVNVVFCKSSWRRVGKFNTVELGGLNSKQLSKCVRGIGSWTTEVS